MTSIASVILETPDPAGAERFYEAAFDLGDRLQVRPADAPTSGFRGFALSLVVAQPNIVDALTDAATRRGATTLKPAKKSFWGYGSVLRAPDGAIWKIASTAKKNSGPPTRLIDDFVLLLGVADVSATRQFYVGHGLPVAKSFGSKYVEFDSGNSPVKLALYSRRAAAKDVGVATDGTGSHRIIILGGSAPFTDPDGFAWEAATAGAPRATSLLRARQHLTERDQTTGLAMLSSCQDTVGAIGGDPTLVAWLGQLQDASFGQAGPAVRKAYPPTRRMTGSQLARYLGRRTYALASTTRPEGRAHAAPTLFTLHANAFWLPTIDGAARLGNVRAHPWLALSIIEGEHDTHAAVLIEGPAEVLPTAPQDVQNATKSRNRAGSLDWATAWLRMTPQRLFSFAERAWEG